MTGIGCLGASPGWEWGFTCGDISLDISLFRVLFHLKLLFVLNALLQETREDVTYL